MDYNEMLFALHIRQEAMKRIAEENQAGLAPSGSMEERLRECIADLVAATRGAAALIKNEIEK